MELQGKIITVLPEKTGTSARGEWKVQEYVVETHDAYPKKMVFSVFGADRISRFNIQVGQEVTVAFDIDAIRYLNNIPFGPAPKAAPIQPAAPAAQPIATEEKVDDLPF